ncbi:MAG: DUF1566 domain-containing protein [Treponema sp.]|nr:DUF1566 domain-containing protein [Treponema sp.]
MKKFLICVILVLVTVMAFGQKPRLVVPPFENRRTTLNNLELENMQDFLINAFINNGTYDVPDRSALATIAAEHNFQLTDWSDDSKSAEMGRVLNANYIVRVIAMFDGTSNILIARILDVNTATGLAAGEMEFVNQREARTKMPDFVSDIVRRIPQTPVRTVNRTYNIGDIGPAGGIIFFDKGGHSDGWRYLEAAPVGTEVGVQWGAYRHASGTDSRGRVSNGWDDINISTSILGTAVGSGNRNTQLIADRLNQLGESGRAAQYCRNLDFNGFKDWFLPSRDELLLMYNNLKQRGLGGFNNSYYWSSSAGRHPGVAGSSPFGMNFGSGNQVQNPANATCLVRAIRSF